MFKDGLVLLTVVVLSYGVGNICAAILLSKVILKNDIRQHGSQNAGTTNMTRVYGIKMGVWTFLIDCLKGLLVVLVCSLVVSLTGFSHLNDLVLYLSGLSVILGHNYPAAFRFRGGKGFATGIGVYMAINPVATVILLAVGLILLVSVDRMSIFALSFFVAEALWFSLQTSRFEIWMVAFSYLYLLLAIIAHWPNILRLMRGEEKGLGLRKRVVEQLKGM